MIRLRKFGTLNTYSDFENSIFSTNRCTFAFATDKVTIDAIDYNISSLQVIGQEIIEQEIRAALRKISGGGTWLLISDALAHADILFDTIVIKTDTVIATLESSAVDRKTEIGLAGITLKASDVPISSGSRVFDKLQLTSGSVWVHLVLGA